MDQVDMDPSLLSNGAAEDDTGIDLVGDDYQAIGGEDTTVNEEPEDIEQLDEVEEEELEAAPAPAKQGRKRKSVEQAHSPEAATAEVKRGRGRPPKKDVAAEPPQNVEERPAKRPRVSIGKGRGRAKKAEAIVDEDEPVRVSPRAAKRSRVSTDSVAATSKAATKAAPAERDPNVRSIDPKKSKTTTAKPSSPTVVKRPLARPKNNGLYILRRETPDDGAGFLRTRSGRNSYKPISYWAGERAIYEEESVRGAKSNFVVQSTKGIIRAEAVVEERRSNKGRGRRKNNSTGKSKRAKDNSEVEQSDSEDIEPWESEPGHIYGDIREWDPNDPAGVQTDERNAEIAISAAAIVTRDIPNSTFRFAKTLTEPFFGSGMVDLPPGGIKKPKNSRKMQMAFFVFTGRVTVMVNDTQFSIGKGGMWQVPRGMWSCCLPPFAGPDGDEMR